MSPAHKSPRSDRGSSPRSGRPAPRAGKPAPRAGKPAPRIRASAALGAPAPIPSPITPRPKVTGGGGLDVSSPSARLVLRKNQDRRVRGGHPWVFSNEVAELQGSVVDGGLVEVTDFRGAFLGIAYYNRHSLICARVLTRKRDAIDTAFFVKRIERALRMREAALPGERAVRVVYGESDQLPGLVVDRYGDVLAVQVLTLGMEVRSDLIREALTEVFKPTGVMRMADTPLRALEGLPLERGAWWGDVPELIEVEVEGFVVGVDLRRGQKTGLFLDQRMNRRRAEARATGRRVLDLFAYQGEWAMHCMRGGAASVMSVDSSSPALGAARVNLERNGLTDGITLRQGDVRDVLRELERKSERFGMVIVDPPALIKSRGAIAAGARAYREINRAAMQLLDEGGVLVTCSCSHHLDDVLFRQVLLESARAAHRPFRVLDWAGEGPDHPQLLAVPETHYLKCAVLGAV